MTVVLRVTEGAVRTGAAKLSLGALRASVNELAFTRGRLQELMRRRPEAFPHHPADPTLVLEDIRSRIDVSITENDFVEDRAETDPPRSARIAIGYTGATPEIAWTISHDLAEMVIGTALAGQRQAISRLETVTGSALDEAEDRLAEVRPLAPDDARARRAVDRLQRSSRWPRRRSSPVAARRTIRRSVSRWSIPAACRRSPPGRYGSSTRPSC